METCVKSYKVLFVFAIALICIILFISDLPGNLQTVQFTYSNTEDEKNWEMATSVYNIKYRTLDEVTKVKVEIIQSERKQRVREVCKQYGKTAQYEWNTPWNFKIDKRNRFMYCGIGKVGTTSWMMKMATSAPMNRSYGLTAFQDPLAHHDSWLSKYNIKPLDAYPMEKWSEKLNKYYKFAFVRHPLERLLSTYLSKVEEREGNTEARKFINKQMNLKSNIISMTRKDKKDTASPVTFEEFLKYAVFDNQHPEDYVDIHWCQYNDACHFCEIDYDFIGSFETLDDDLSYVLTQIYQNKEDRWFPECNPSNNKIAMDYYRNISKKLIGDVEDAYKFDFDLFGFEKGRY